ncbi:MAG TPA: PAS domain-containing protein, partial [Sandaracinaceae bacterium LLY-WYZ-13_1]|nr:PAS domain-containing protein [Sandaracinaceae bacterium LLY-WYZ-13_1]
MGAVNERGGSAAERPTAPASEAEDRRALDALRAAGLGSCEMDLRARSVRWDRRACAIFGVPPSEPVRSFDDLEGLLHPADRPALRRALDAAIEGDGTHAAELRVVDPRGGWRWVSIRGRVRFDGGAPAALLGVVEDVTGRKSRDLDAGREARMLALSHDAILAWAPSDGLVHFWNRGATDLYGHAVGEALGSDRRALVPSTYGPRWREIEQTLRRRGRWEGEGRHRTRDGHERMVSTRMQLLIDDATGPLVLEVNRDVTAEWVARREVEAANRNKDAFLAQLGHELRRPLSAIVHAAELQGTMAPSDPAQARITGTVRRQATQMRWLVDDLLDLTRVAHGKTELRHETVVLRDLVVGVLEDQREAIEAAGIRLDVAIDSDVSVEGDPARLTQILENLLGNAAKFTPAEGRITVTLARVRGEAVLAVEDDGIGMSEDQRDELFEPFRQAREGAGGGLGLGLALVRR